MDRQLKAIEKDTVKVHAEKQHEKKRVLIESQTVRPNHRCFQINTNTGEIVEADYKYELFLIDGLQKQVDIKEGCVYILAMNKPNALKKYNKQRVAK